MFWRQSDDFAYGDFFGTQPGQCRGATLMSLGFLSEMTLETLKAS